MGAGYAKEATDLGAPQSGIFLRTRLDDPNQIESLNEIGFYAHAIFSCAAGAKSREMHCSLILLLCPSS
jgi:hypothetical protein